MLQAARVVMLLPCVLVSVHAQHTTKNIFGKYRQAIVRIQVVIADSNSQRPGVVNRGTGFVVADNVIVTSNHVVTYDDARSKYLPNIHAELFNGKRVRLKPILTSPSDDGQKYDYAILRPEERLGINSVELGSWSDVKEGDELTTIGYSLNLAEPLLLSCLTSAIYAESGIDVIVFQGPNNKGLSGAPLFSNQTGKVVAIVTTRIVGIGEKLSAIKTEASKARGAVKLGGGASAVDPNDAIVELTGVLDAHLMSGMGAAIAINYASLGLKSIKSP